jgi:hypothetical protein
MDQVTRRLTKKQGKHRLYPKQVESFEPASPEQEPVEHHFRYVCPCASCYGIGIRDPFEGYKTPVWMRFHKGTKQFRQIRQLIESSGVDSLRDRGHLWIPLKVLPEVPGEQMVSGEQMVQGLIDQVEEILRIALPAE